MPKAWSAKDERQYEHIKQSERKRGGKRAAEIAARTVNKQRRQEGRTAESRPKAPAKRGARKARRGRARSSKGARSSKSARGRRSTK